MAATEAMRNENVSESIEALSREAEQLKAKIDEERSKLSDVDRKPQASRSGFYSLTLVSALGFV